MATATATNTGIAPFGVITLDGIQYIERPQVFCLELPITQPNQVYTNQRLTLPGVADYLLKGLSRDILSPPGPLGPHPNQSRDRRFRFRMVNGEGSTWFFTGGLGVFDDRVVDSLCFGSAQFPYMLIPAVPVHSTGSLIFEVEDIGAFGNQPVETNYYPYTIYFAFHGTYLLPANSTTSTGYIL